MGWGPGTPAAHPYPKSWQVTPPPPCPLWPDKSVVFTRVDSDTFKEDIFLYQTVNRMKIIILTNRKKWQVNCRYKKRASITLR